MKIALFSDAGPTGAMAEAVVRSAAPEAQVLAVRSRRNLLPEGLPDIRQFDLLLSCLNPLILPAGFLGHTALGAYNVHPGLPDYPGRDPYHWAFLCGEARAGATVHTMLASVDSGEIFDVLSCGFNRAEGIEPYIWACTGLALQLLGNVAREVSASGQPLQKKGEWSWNSGNRKARSDIEAMRRIAVDGSHEEIERRIEALHVEGQAEVYLDVGGRRFYYRS